MIKMLGFFKNIWFFILVTFYLNFYLNFQHLVHVCERVKYLPPSKKILWFLCMYVIILIHKILANLYQLKKALLSNERTYKKIDKQLKSAIFEKVCRIF